MVKWDLFLTLVLAGIVFIIATKILDNYRISVSTQSALNSGDEVQIQPQTSRDWVRQHYPDASTI